MSEVVRLSSEAAASEDAGQDIQEAFQAVDAYSAQAKGLGLRERFLARIAVRRVGKAGRALSARRGKEAPAMGVNSVIRMKGALDGVDAQTREVFQMYRLEGMTYAQISWRTGLSISAVEKHLARALVTLAGAMEEG